VGVGLTSKASSFQDYLAVWFSLKEQCPWTVTSKQLEKVMELGISLPIVQNAVRSLVYPQSLENL
jgi:hypothetical protein